jgi:glucuronoarabinoxylan endo-1,4-beta-xylanase
MNSILRNAYITSLFLLAACTERTDASDRTVGSKRLALGDSSSTPVVISVEARKQRITGFGASSAWTTTGVTDAQADQLFTPQGLGISILRMRIAPDGTSGETLTATRAAQRGVLLWAAPWSPPGIWKTTGSDTNGGSLKPEYYQNWANRLAGFAASMKTRGLPLFALSVQNEPDWVAEWETCVWSPEELVKFTRDYLAPALKIASPTTKILAPESANWDDLESFADPFFADAAAKAAIDIVATHSYGGLARMYPAAAQAGKEFWETEVSYETSDDISATLGTAKMIHTHLTLAEVNAWHYWWINSDSTSSLFRSGVMLPQANGLAHYAKFVRPGYYRVSAEPRSPSAGVSVSAFVDAASPRLVMVAINETPASVTQTFDFGTTSIGAVTAWVTQESGAFVENSPMEGGSSFAFDLPATSVVTFVSSRPFEGAGGSTSTGGATSTSGGSAGSLGFGGDSTEGGDAGSAGEGAIPSSHAGRASTGGASGRGGASSRGGATSSAGTGSGGAPSLGGAPMGSGGQTGLGGLIGDAGTGGTTAGQVPEAPFLPGCYCTTAPTPVRGGSPILPALVGIAVSLRGASRSRRLRLSKR